MSTLLHAAVTVAALAAWVTIVLTISGLWRPGQRWRWLSRLLTNLPVSRSDLPTEHAAWTDKPDR
jgi:hypothetical protein